MEELFIGDRDKLVLKDLVLETDIQCVVFAPPSYNDGNSVYLLVGLEYGVGLVVYTDTKTEQSLRHVATFSLTKARINSIVVSKSTKMVATLAFSTKIELWQYNAEAETHNERLKYTGVVRNMTEAIDDVVFNTDGSFLACHTHSGNVYIWDIQNKTKFYSCKTTGFYHYLVFHWLSPTSFAIFSPIDVIAQVWNFDSASLQFTKTSDQKMCKKHVDRREWHGLATPCNHTKKMESRLNKFIEQDMPDLRSVDYSAFHIAMINISNCPHIDSQSENNVDEEYKKLSVWLNPASLNAFTPAQALSFIVAWHGRFGNRNATITHLQKPTVHLILSYAFIPTATMQTPYTPETINEQRVKMAFFK